MCDAAKRALGFADLCWGPFDGAVRQAEPSLAQAARNHRWFGTQIWYLQRFTELSVSLDLGFIRRASSEGCGDGSHCPLLKITKTPLQMVHTIQQAKDGVVISYT